MIRQQDLRSKFSYSLAIAIILHVVFFFVAKDDVVTLVAIPSPNVLNKLRPLKIDRISMIKPEDVEKIRRVGVKDGLKDKYFRPDMIKPQPPPPAPPAKKGAHSLSLENLGANLPVPKMVSKSAPLVKTPVQNTPTMEVRSNNDDSNSHFYYNPKKEKKIKSNTEQDTLKQEAYRNMTVNSGNPVAQKLSNFEIRYERPEGVSEDELNSDEKAYYSFFKRSYSNYLQKLYATYDKISVARPALDRALEEKHLLIGRIDYDEKGNIVTIKILKSSNNDDVHYFFEETLKQLNLPNPPKSFIKNKKAFTTYYQIQIN